ncbi:MAG: phenylalanine--tRNA ligase subunit alpha [Coprobacillus sp.]|nr:phenylalanine--tRNA ligase subunit alpha [Coprobacillus sp.]
MSLKDNIEELRKTAFAELSKIVSSADITTFRNRFFAKRGELALLTSQLPSLSDKEKREYGSLLSRLREELTSAFESRSEEITLEELNEKLAHEKLDITLPGRGNSIGAKNPFYIIRDEIADIFLKMGYEVKEGPEVESDLYNFERLNIPKDHPARDMQDSLYINENLLLRSQTSNIQARVMEEKAGKPFKIICPGKTYRRDDDDATHSHQFAQIEGLVVDKGINMAHLKATLEVFAKAMFGEKREVRFRPSFFPFTEPSVEVDVSCGNCGGKGCSMCKNGYIEILGAGMVHPNVLKINGYDPEVYSGFAFGIGIERVAMLRYGIDDIRRFYTNDVRFLEQFKKKVS